MDLLHGLLLLHQADVAPSLACQLVSQDLPAVYELCCHAAPDMEKLKAKFAAAMPLCQAFPPERDCDTIL